MKSLLLKLVFLVFYAVSVNSQAADKIIGIVVFDGVLSSDITAPAEVFGIASKKSWFSDYKVQFINVADRASITTEEGITINVDAYLSQQPEVDVLLIPSSYEMKPLINNQELGQYIKASQQRGAWLASNCSGAFVLAEAGVLEGKRATTYSGGERGFQRAFPGVKVQHDSNYVIDGKIITSNGSVVSYQAALVLLEQLAGKAKANEVKDALQMGRFCVYGEAGC